MGLDIVEHLCYNLYCYFFNLLIRLNLFQLVQKNYSQITAKIEFLAVIEWGGLDDGWEESNT